MARRPWRALVFVLVTVVALSVAGRADARPRTDIVTLANGDRITGEVIRLERGRLEFKTDDIGTIYVEWDKVAGLEAPWQFEVGTTDGSRYLGTIAGGVPRTLAVTGPGTTVSLPMAAVTLITPIGQSLWKRLDGSIDVGFSYTRSSDIAQLNFNSETIHRRARSDARLRASLTATQQKASGARDDRGAVDASYIRYLGAPWFASAAARLETNESLGIRLRSQVGGAFGPRLVNTNRAQGMFGCGLFL